MPGVVVGVVLAGARSYTAITEWTAHPTLAVRIRLELGRRLPSESTIRRVLQRLDALQLDPRRTWTPEVRSHFLEFRRGFGVDVVHWDAPALSSEVRATQSSPLSCA